MEIIANAVTIISGYNESISVAMTSNVAESTNVYLHIGEEYTVNCIAFLSCTGVRKDSNLALYSYLWL